MIFLALFLILECGATSNVQSVKTYKKVCMHKSPSVKQYAGCRQEAAAKSGNQQFRW